MNFAKIFKGNFFLRVNINSPLWLVPTYTSQYYWGFSWTHIQLSSQSQFRIHPYSRINAYNWVRLYDGFALYFRILAYVCSEKLSEFDHITVYRNVRLESYKANSYFFPPRRSWTSMRILSWIASGNSGTIPPNHDQMEKKSLSSVGSTVRLITKLIQHFLSL